MKIPGPSEAEPAPFPPPGIPVPCGSQGTTVCLQSLSLGQELDTSPPALLGHPWDLQLLLSPWFPAGERGPVGSVPATRKQEESGLVSRVLSMHLPKAVRLRGELLHSFSQHRT